MEEQYIIWCRKGLATKLQCQKILSPSPSMICQEVAVKFSTSFTSWHALHVFNQNQLTCHLGSIVFWMPL